MICSAPPLLNLRLLDFWWRRFGLMVANQTQPPSPRHSSQSAAVKKANED